MTMFHEYMFIDAYLSNGDFYDLREYDTFLSLVEVGGESVDVLADLLTTYTSSLVDCHAIYELQPELRGRAERRLDKHGTFLMQSFKRFAEAKDKEVQSCIEDAFLSAGRGISIHTSISPRSGTQSPDLGYSFEIPLETGIICVAGGIDDEPGAEFVGCSIWVEGSIDSSYTEVREAWLCYHEYEPNPSIDGKTHYIHNSSWTGFAQAYIDAFSLRYNISSILRL